MVRILSADDVRPLLDLTAVGAVVDEALVAQAAGAVERPERPHFPIGRGLDAERPEEPLGTGLMMAAYVHGSPHFATKVVGVSEGADGETTTAQITLADAETGAPVAVMDGGHVTGARTGAIGGLAVRELTDGPITMAVVGTGTQAGWQVRAIDAMTEIDRAAFYSPNEESRTATAAAARDELGIEAFSVDDPNLVVGDADVVVAATTSEVPVFDGDELGPDTVVLGIGAYTEGMQELDARTVDRADRILADVPEEVTAIGDIAAASPSADVESLGAFLAGDRPSVDEDAVVVVESVGTAVVDAAAAEYVYEEAVEADVGTVVSLS
ncbi:MAG: ornithine cyclodeaminase family protein [Halanaeroarchaeum sp.]